MNPKIRLFSPSLLCSSFGRYRNVNSGRRFLYCLAILLMLYDVYSEGSRPKLGCGTDCLDRAFSCFYSVPEFTLEKVPGSGHMFLPNFFQYIFHPLPIIRGSLVFDKEASLNNPQKYKRNSDVCSISISFVIIQWAKCRQWLARTPHFLGLCFIQNPNFTSI